MSRVQRLVLYFGVCITLRALGALAVRQYYDRPVVAGALALVYLLLGASMMYLFVSGKRQGAPEGGGITWWNGLRPFHSVLYLLTALGLACAHRLSYVFPVLDVVLGVVAVLVYRVAWRK